MENYIFTYIYIIYIKREINGVAFKGLKDKTKTKTKKKIYTHCLENFEKQIYKNIGEYCMNINHNVLLIKHFDESFQLFQNFCFK